MTMTPDDLRALADALDPSGKVLTHPGESALQRAAAHLRAQVDAQPVAMLASHRRLIEQAIQSAENPSGMSTHDGKARIDASILRRMLAIIDSLPAAPQAEPKREPLTALRILEIEDNASRQWRDNGRIVEYAVVFARLIESAHGIGGSDAE